MTDFTEPSAWHGTRAELTSATGLHPRLYTDDLVFGVEQQRVFERAWVCVGLVPELTGPGSVLVRNVGRRSVLITTTDDGGLRGFINSCRHRGTELLESDCAVRTTIRCPYHRWGYDRDGTLVSTPHFDDVPREAFDRADYGLVSVRVEAWGFLLFACMDPNTVPLADWLGDLPDRMAGYGLDSWHLQASMTVGVEANWKLISENFQEYYHLPWVHPGLATVSRVADHYRYQGSGMYCGQTTTPVSDAGGDTWLALPPKDGLDRSDSVSGRHVAIFPNVIMSVLPNHAFVARLNPAGPGSTVEACSWLLPGPATDDEAFAATKKFWLEVNDEDIGIVQRSQRGLAAGTVPAGPLAPRFEEPLHRFHNMLADCMTSDDPSAFGLPAGDKPGADEAHGGAPNPTPPAIESGA